MLFILLSFNGLIQIYFFLIFSYDIISLSVERLLYQLQLTMLPFIWAVLPSGWIEILKVKPEEEWGTTEEISLLFKGASLPYEGGTLPFEGITDTTNFNIATWFVQSLMLVATGNTIFSTLKIFFILTALTSFYKKHTSLLYVTFI